MAKPRIFVSSTYYDLKHLRSALENFVEGLGFEPVLSEKGSIAYAPDLALDESCYREARQADIMVLIVGGRYGSERSGANEQVKADFYARYDSVTREEFRAASRQGVPIYVLVDRAVYAEYQTFLKNRDGVDVKYAHVDSVNIFRMIEEILALPRNNPVFAFDRYHEVEIWLREQWAGLFQELLRRRAAQEQITSLSAQVAQLSESNRTLKLYLESLMTRTPPDKSKSLIDAESKRLDELQKYRAIEQNPFVDYVCRSGGIDLLDVGKTITEAANVAAILKELQSKFSNPVEAEFMESALEQRTDYVLTDINKARRALNLTPLRWGFRRRRSDNEDSDIENSEPNTGEAPAN